MHHAKFLAHSAGGCPVFGMAARRCNSSTPELYKCNVPTHSASGCLVTRRDDSSSGCTVELCEGYMHHAKFLPTLQVDAPYFGMPACGCNSSTPKPRMLHHSVSGCPISWWDDGSSGCTVEPCNMLHAPCYAHSAGGCPSFRDDGSRGAPPSCANATRTKHHASPTLHVDAPLFSGMTARRLYRQAMQR
jgi:hypothetical protein